MSAYPSFSTPFRARLLTGCALAAAATGTQAQAQRAFQATPNGVVNASIIQNTGLDIVRVQSEQALIDWLPDAGAGTINILAAGDELRFQADNAGTLPRYTVLNRIVPADTTRAIRIDGIVNSLVDTGYGVSDGSIWFYSPGGIILGGTSRFDVGSLVLTANNIQVGSFDSEGLFVGASTAAQTGTIAFRGAADSRSFVSIEAGAKINATGSYVALVAPRVAQRGAITVNGSAAMITAESADITIPVSGNLFEIAVFSGSKVDAGGETTLIHSGKTEITDPQQTGNSRRIYMIAVPKNDAITALVSGTLGYEAASTVTASAGRVILEAGSGIKIVADNPQSTAPVAAANVTLQGVTSNVGFAVGGINLTLDATAASSTFGGFLSLNSGESSKITIANSFKVDVGQALGGSLTLGVAPSTVSVSSNGALTVAGDLRLASNIGAALGNNMALTVDDGTVQVNGLFVSSIAGGLGAPLTGSTGGDVAVTIRNNGLVSVTNAATIESRGVGVSTAGSGATGTGGKATLTIESGGLMLANSVTVASLGTGGNGTGNGGAGQAGLASLTIDGGSIETGYGLSIRALGQGGSSEAVGGQAGAGIGGTVTVGVTNGGKVDVNSLLELAANGTGGSETGYGAVVGGAGTGGGISFTTSVGGLVQANALTIDATGRGLFGKNGGGAGSGGDAAISLNAATLDVGSMTIALDGFGGNGNQDTALGGAAIGGDATIIGVSGTLSTDSLTITADASGGQGVNGPGGSAQAGSATVSLTEVAMPGDNLLRFEAVANGGNGSVGGEAKGGTTALLLTGTKLATFGDVTFDAEGFGGIGDADGGAATGGQIEIKVAAGGSFEANAIRGLAQGFAGRSFGNGSGGEGNGGVIRVASSSASVLRGITSLNANGFGGDGDFSGFAASGFGGLIDLKANGGTIEAGYGSLTLSADGIGGISEADEIAPLAAGGGIGIEVSGAGRLVASTLQATADGRYEDQSDGIIVNHGGNAVGGTVRLRMTGGELVSDDVLLSASGTGAVSRGGGVGGTGFQGRAELAMSGGTFTGGDVTVSARAEGGPGIDEDSDGGPAAGDGGAANIGTSPFVDVTGAGGQAGAVVSMTGGTLIASLLTVDGTAIGGDGGPGDGFGETMAPGSGGAAQGGIATFSTSGAMTLDIDTLSVGSSAFGGAGGSLFLGEGSESDSFAGFGGAATGGLMSVTIGGSGVLNVSIVEALSNATGGDGGEICGLFCGPTVGSGRGGDGGAAIAGGANVTILDGLENFSFLTARASADGGSGGAGPDGGSGGGATGGSATLAVADGTGIYAGFQAFADATGGFGADGLGGNAGAGGAATAGNATLTIGAAAKLQTGVIDIAARGSGGDGGRGADGDTVAFDGGNGGAATGGTAKITVTDGSLTLLDGSEVAPAMLRVTGTGGFGGNGGDAIEGIGGAGGNGGNASGGTATIASKNGAINLFATTMEADAVGGSGGTSGEGFQGVDSALGFGKGGGIVIDAQQAATPANRVLLGVAELTANGDTAGIVGARANPGTISITANGSNAAGALAFDEIFARAQGNEFPAISGTSIAISATGTPISVGGRVSMAATRLITFSMAGDAGLRATGPVEVASFEGIRIDHSGQAAGGPAASLSGGTVDLFATGDLLASATSRINAAGNASLGSGSAVSLGSAKIGGDLFIDARTDITVGAGAQAIVDRAVSFRAGDDIIVDTVALLRAANNAPAETGYGASDPLLQESQMRLYAGALEEPPADGSVASILLRGDIQAPQRTIQLEAAAIQGSDAASVSGGNLYVRIFDVPTGAPLDDFGQLTAPCLQGSVCLGDVGVTDIVQIGQSGFEPLNLRLNGGIDGTDVRLAARDTIRLGRASVTSTIKASKALTIDAQTGDLLTLGTIAVTGPAGVTFIGAGREIVAPGLSVTASGGLDLRSGGDVVLNGISAPVIRSVDASAKVINAGGITSAGLIDIGKLTTSGNLFLDAAQSVTLGQATASKVDVVAGGSIAAGFVVATGSTIALKSGQDIDVGSLSSIGIADLRAEQGTVVVSSSANTEGGLVALGRMVTLLGSNGLNIISAKATAGNLTLTTGEGNLVAGDLVASQNILMDIGGGITFGTLNAGGAITGTGFGPIVGGDATASSIALTTTGSVTASDLVATAGPLTVIGDTGITLNTAAATGLTTLKATQGLVKVGTDLRPVGGLSITALSIDLTAKNGLTIAEAVATAGDLKLTTSAGDLVAGTSSATGAIALDSAGALSFTALNAQQSVSLKAQNTIAGTAVTSKAGGVSAIGNKGVTIGTIAAAGPVTLGASAGAILVGTDISATGPIQATAQAISLTATNDLIVAQAQATGGDIVLRSRNGNLTLGQASATKALSATAANLLSVNGAASGATIAFSSKDIAIGSSGQLGTVSQTTQLTLTSTADRSVLGGAGGGTGYRLDAAEIGRIAGQNISFVSQPQDRNEEAFSFVQPGATSVVMEGLTFGGAQLGSTGLFTIQSSRTIGVTGDVLFKGFSSGQRVLYSAGQEISLAAETGLVRVLDNAGGLAGVLELRAPQVTAMSVPARAAIPNLTLNEVEQRLGTNDQVENDGGYFQAGRIIVKIDRLVFIQNSGASSAIDDRRGFSANAFDIETGYGSAQVVINGRVGNAVGADLAGAITFTGGVDPISTFSGCILNSTSCGGPAPEFAAPAISSARDQIEDEEDEDEKEEALQAAQTRPDPIIQFIDTPDSRFDPLIDEPVTGAGNEDFWETPLVPTPGG